MALKLNKFEPGIIPGRKMRQKKRWFGVDGDADSLGPWVFRVGLGAATETNVLTRTRTLKKKKESRFKLRWLKESYYNTNK